MIPIWIIHHGKLPATAFELWPVVFSITMAMTISMAIIYTVENMRISIALTAMSIAAGVASVAMSSTPVEALIMNLTIAVMAESIALGALLLDGWRIPMDRVSTIVFSIFLIVFGLAL